MQSQTSRLFILSSLSLSCLFLGLVLGSAFLVGCGSTASPQPAGYVFTDEFRLTSLTWNQRSDGQLSGQWTEVLYDPSLLSATAKPEVTSRAYTGTFQNQQVIMTLSPGGTMHVGQMQGNTLVFNDVNDSGQRVVQTWLAVSSQDASLLVHIFNAYEHVQGALMVVKQDVQLKPFDGISAGDLRLQEQSAQNYVDMLKARLVSMQQDLSEASRCQKARDFAQISPTSQSVFDLYGQAGDIFLNDIGVAQDRWKLAQSLALPHINGLKPSWFITQRQFNVTLVLAQQAVQAFQQAHQSELHRMETLKSQYQSIGTQVDAIRRSC